MIQYGLRQLFFQCPVKDIFLNFKGAVAKPESFATDFFYLFQLNAIKITKKNPIYVLNIGYFSNGMFEK